MRISILAAGLALALAACGGKNQAENTMNADEGLSAQNIVSNDVTAIDAVTGDASNMAADVNYLEPLNGEDNAAGNGNASMKMASPRKPSPGKPPLEIPAPATQAPTNNAAE